MPMAELDYHPIVSVVIPVYNAASTLGRTLESVFNQSYSHIEIITINDGSTDGSLALLKQCAAKWPNITIIDQQNHGQGYCRNRAIQRASGEYILFLDADDWLERSALTALVAASDHGRADIVHCGWKAGNTGVAAHRTGYMPNEIFVTTRLTGTACDEFTRLYDYFSVNNLFRRQFLMSQGIVFGEGYIYEDNEFMVAAANRAQTIRFVNKMLYVVNFHGASSTRGMAITDKHYRDFMMAITQSFAAFRPRLPQTSAYLANYFLEKFTIYYQYRVPGRYKWAYRHEFVDIMSQLHIKAGDASISKFLQLCIRQKVFVYHRYRVFWLLLLYKTRLAPLISR